MTKKLDPNNPTVHLNIGIPLPLRDDLMRLAQEKMITHTTYSRMVLADHVKKMAAKESRKKRDV